MIAAAAYLGAISALPDRNGENPFVLDGAGAIPASVGQEIYRLNTLSEKGRVYIVTVAKTGKYSLERYAKKLAENWKINAGTDVLLAAFPSEERFYAVWGSCFSQETKISLDEEFEETFLRGDVGGAAGTFVREALSAAALSAESGDGGTYSSGFRLKPLTVVIIVALIAAVAALFSRVIYEPRGGGDGTTYYYPPAWMYIAAARKVEKSILDKYAEVKKKFSPDAEDGQGPRE